LICSGPIRTIICGGVGGVSLWIAIFPFDVIKSRVQIQSANSPKNPPFVTMLAIIAREEGMIVCLLLIVNAQLTI
jgi:solute carrier family 25 ornithine transporter 2/15